MPVVTLAKWKTYRGYSGTDYDATVTALIPQVQSEMERYCGRSFDSTAHTDEAIDGTGTAKVYTRNWPITTMGAVKVRNGSGSTTTLSPSEYRVAVGNNSLGRLIRLGGNYGGAFEDVRPALSNGPCWPVGSENVLVTYTAGYSDATVPMPPDLTLAACVLVDMRLQERGISIEVGAEGSGNQNRTARTVAELTARYRVLMGPFARVPI